ncbi:peptide ABC transporter substrate-binding protein [Comamonadaceae bacterium G21597-S1]|nr:peptide ABC transporter substrate-binding protein [Comamonadaceae bacterium G21597-S1]
MKTRYTLIAMGTLIALSQSALAQRGSSGNVNIIYWQAPSILNPYLSTGTKDVESASLVLEPLIRFNEKGEMVPWLAAEVPTVANGGFSADFKTITYKLKPGLKWSDGTPLTSADVVFTYEYCTGIKGCAKANIFAPVEKVTAVDASTIRINFKAAAPYPYSVFGGAGTPILQKAQFKDCLGEKAPSCSQQNFNPIGTGPFMVKDFRPNDVIQMVANPNFRDPAKPAFATLTFKGGGDAAAAGRAVMETGEYDYAWNLQLAPDVIKKMQAGGKGKTVAAFGTLVERIEMNLTDPSPKHGDMRATTKHPRPYLTDMRVRKALSMAIDRDLLVEIGYGPAGRATCNLVPAPAAFASNNTDCLKQDMAGAKALLDQAGWKMGSDGVRAKDGVKMEMLYQTSTNAVRQNFQALIKQWWTELGVKVELRNIAGSVFFGGDAGSPDTFQKFFADVEMYANNFDGTDPEGYLAEHVCDKIPRPETQWQGTNMNRYCNPEYDKLVKELSSTAGVEKRAVIAKKLNDMLTKESYVVVPLVDRGRVSAHSNSLGGVKLNTWDSELWNVADWYRIK